MNDLSAGDIVAMTKGNDNDDSNEMWNNPFMMLIWLKALGGGLLGNDGAAAGMISNDFLYTNLNNGMERNFMQTNASIGNVENRVNDGFSASQMSMLNGFGQTNLQMCESFHGVADHISQVAYQTAVQANENAFQIQLQAATQSGTLALQAANASRELAECCCATNRNIDQSRYEAATSLCTTLRAIHEDGELTRGLINANTVQELRDQLNDAKNSIDNNLQSQYLVSQLQPRSIPAYITCSPFANNGFTGC